MSPACATLDRRCPNCRREVKTPADRSNHLSDIPHYRKSDGRPKASASSFRLTDYLSKWRIRKRCIRGALRFSLED